MKSNPFQILKILTQYKKNLVYFPSLDTWKMCTRAKLWNKQAIEQFKLDNDQHAPRIKSKCKQMETWAIFKTRYTTHTHYSPQQQATNQMMEDSKQVWSTLHLACSSQLVACGSWRGHTSSMHSNCSGLKSAPTWLSSPSKMTMAKKRMDQSGATGIWDTAVG